MKVSLFKSASSANRPKAGQSIRGKISGPIPIPNPIDDEFPMRNPGTGIAIPLGPRSKEHQLQPPPEGSSTVSGASGSRPGVAQSKTDSVLLASGSNPASIFPDISPPQGTNQSSTLRYSTVSASTTRTGQSKDAPQRKKSTIRHALGKLFGRKRKNGSQGSSSTERMAGLAGTGLHRSDPSALGRPITKEGEPKRSASLPITEYDRALRSHSVGPEDITAIESARNSMQGEQAFRARRRAATTTSQIYAPLRPRELEELTGLSPRPVSTQGRSSRVLPGEEDPNEIGRAITSDIIGHRRRSRSLSGLEDVADNQVTVRRRSDEIRYWRESYDPGFMSPLSSNAPEGDDTGPLDVELPVNPGMDKPNTPPQPFMFGTLASMNQMAGMKITQAASLETRLDSLEARMRRMERVVTQLCNKVPGFKLQVELPERSAPSVPPSDPSFTFTTGTTSTAPVNPAIYQTTSQDLHASSQYGGSRHSESSHSRTSFGEAPTYIGSLHPSTALGPAPIHRPNSNSTVRGATSLPVLPRDITGPFTADHYTTLLALVETERSARQALEAQVRKLNQRLNIMSISEATQRDHAILLDPPPTAKSFGQTSAFDDDDDDDNDNDDDDEPGAEVEAKGRSMQPEDSGIATGGDHEGGEDVRSEDFATPQEDRTFGAFGEELREDAGDGTRKKAARTLSLSQLTLPKPKVETPPPAVAQERLGSDF